MLKDIQTKISGAISAVKTLGIKIVLLEVMRRIFKLSYNVHGIPVDSDYIFRALRDIRKIGGSFTLTKEYIRIKLPYGIIDIPKSYRELISIDTIRGGIEKSYGELNVKDKVVIDIGAYIGDTALYFISKGASKVYAYEPIPLFYELLVRTIKINNLSNRIHPYNYGMWYAITKSYIKLSGGVSGLLANTGSRKVIQIKTKKFSDILFDDVIPNLQRDTFLCAKIDCEGCEYSLICEPCHVLKLVNEYIIEIHGSETIIVDKMRKCGFQCTLLNRKHHYKYSPRSIWLFRI